MTTKHNESIHSILFAMVPRKDRDGLPAMELRAALAIIRYNEGYKAVQNIIISFSQSDPFIRTQEAFRLLGSKRILSSRNPIRGKTPLLKRKCIIRSFESK